MKQIILNMQTEYVNNKIQLIAIVAVKMNYLTKQHEDIFYRFVLPPRGTKPSRTWWTSLSTAHAEGMRNDPQTLSSCLIAFGLWCESVRRDEANCLMWSENMTSDIELLEKLFQATDHNLPLQCLPERDLTTFYASLRALQPKPELNLLSLTERKLSSMYAQFTNSLMQKLLDWQH